MKFWDASAIVPLLVAEAESDACRKILSEDSEIAVWCLTAVETTSALNRRRRERRLKPEEYRAAKNQLRLLEVAWAEITAIDRTRALARRLLEKHPLRAADSLQLAAALLLSDNNPQSIDFVCLDNRLNLAAENEGFNLVFDRAVR